MVETKIVETNNYDLIVDEYKYFGWLVHSYKEVHGKYIICFYKKEESEDKKANDLFNAYESTRELYEKTCQIKNNGNLPLMFIFFFFAILSLIFCIIALSWLTVLFLVINLFIAIFLLSLKLIEDKKKKKKIETLISDRNKIINKIKEINNK